MNLKSEGQTEGELGTIGNFLAPYQHPAVAEVFCSDHPDTITIDQVDRGRKICLSISEEYAHERKYLFSVLKLLFYRHGLRRLDLKARDPDAFWRKNLLLLVGEEFQDVVTSSVGGMSDYTVSGKVREANVALIVLTQSSDDKTLHFFGTQSLSWKILKLNAWSMTTAATGGSSSPVHWIKHPKINTKALLMVAAAILLPMFIALSLPRSGPAHAIADDSQFLPPSAPRHGR